MRKSPGYWREWTNLENILLPICKKLNRFPSTTELNSMGMSSLVKYALPYFGGHIEVAHKLGYKTYDEIVNRHHADYWTKEKVIEEYKKFINEHKLTYYPSHRALSLNGKDDLKNAIYKLYGFRNFKKVIKEHGVHLERTRSNSNKWNENRVIEELKIIINQLGYFPSKADFDYLNRNDLRGAINKFGGDKKFISICKAKSKAEFKNIKPAGYWKNWKNIEPELEKICKSIGRFPSKVDFFGLGYRDLYSALKYHGTLKAIASKFGFDYKYQNQFFTLDGDYVLSIYEVLFDNFLYLNKIPHEVNGVIDTEAVKTFRYDFLIHGEKKIYVEIWGLSNSKTQKSKKYDEKRIEKEKFYRSKGLKLVSVEPDLFDGDFYLIYENLKSFCINSGIKKEDFYLNENYIELFIAKAYSFEILYNDILPFIDLNNGFMPTASFLKQNGATKLISKIRKFGGFAKIKNKFGILSDPKTLRYIKK